MVVDEFVIEVWKGGRECDVGVELKWGEFERVNGLNEFEWVGLI